jgi:flagellar motility protein MotE (MotC chaperone)
MKNFLILGLLAMFLFSVSAALSLWLNQSKPEQTAEKEKGREKKKDEETEKEKEKEKAGKEPKEEHKSIVPKPEEGHGAIDVGASLQQREEKLKYRAAQMDLVVRDLQVQREATDAALAKVLTELKNVGAETAKLDALAKDLRDQRVQFEAGEKKNIEKIANMYDAMSPESAAPVLKEMVEKGKLDMAAKILAQMKERNAARVLEAMNDPSLETQLLARVRDLRAAAPVTPAKGP